MAETVTNTKDALKSAKKVKGRTHLVVLIDESGSMSGLEEAVTNGCNEFLHEFKDRKKTRVWLAWFDSHPGEDILRIKVRNEKPKSVESLGIADFNPRGMTPLNDSILQLLTTLGREVEDDDTVFMAIITDGKENASESQPADVRRAIANYEEKGWAFVYLGANQHAETSAMAIGLRRQGQAFNVAATRGGLRSTMRSVGGMAQAHSVAYEEHGAGAQALMASEATRSALYTETGGKIEEDEDDLS